MEINIIPFQEKDKAYIKTLNYEWLEKYFYIEPNDVLQLSNPTEEIINKGGYIYYAAIDNSIIGVAALMKVDETCFELSKMAVNQLYQGKGIGKFLLEHCLKQAKEIGAQSVILYSNTKLTTAITMYRQYGFEEISLQDTHYTRANIKMKLTL